MVAPLTEKVSRTASCWAWSSSPGSVTGAGKANLSIARPTSSSISGSSQSTNFGPTTPAFDRKASATSADTVFGSRYTSSWQNR